MKTEKRKRIDGIYKVLALYEDAIDDKNVVTFADYLTYVKKLSIMYDGFDNEEFYGLLNGLYKAGESIEFDNVKSIVFHMISIIDKG